MQEASRAAAVIAMCLESDEATAARTMAAYVAEISEGQSRAKDMIDTFWTHPLAFLKIAHTDHKDDLAELFSGRIYGEAPGRLTALQQMQRLMRLRRAPAQG